MSAKEKQCDAAGETYPTIKSSPFVWIPPHLEADGVRPKFPPRKPELRKPLLWIAVTNNQAWLVNCCSQALPRVVVTRGGAGGGDEPAAYNANEDWIYRDVPPGFCALVDEWDGFYDLDFYLSCYLDVEVPGYGKMSFCASGTSKGRIDEQVLLWDNGDKGGQR